MIPEKLLEILKHDGVVAIATLGEDGPHMVNTRNSYIRVTDDDRLLIPAGYMHRTEANVATNSSVLVTLGSSKVAGMNGPGTGFLIKGTAVFMASGPDFEATQARFKWARACWRSPSTPPLRPCSLRARQESEEAGHELCGVGRRQPRRRQYTCATRRLLAVAAWQKG